MRRIILLLAVIVIGAAAPVRAWCEASCLVPAHDTTSHCPSHQQERDGTSISSTSLDACPALDSARPTAPARLDTVAAIAVFHAPELRTSAIQTPMRIRPHSASTVFERSTPLRI
jgi:hypothetical protein